MSLIPFPNIANLPGVPQLNRVNNVVNTATLAGRALTSLLGQPSKPVWGIFDRNNAAVVAAQSVYAFDYRAEWALLDYTIQDGAFASYNKVVKPFETSVRLTQGGSLSDRQTVLNQLQAIAGDTNLYNIHSPEKSYLNVNITRVELLRRSSEGAVFLEVDVYFKEIRQIAGQYSNPSTANASNPAAVPSAAQGNQQPQPVVPPAASASASAALTQAPL